MDALLYARRSPRVREVDDRGARLPVAAPVSPLPT